MRVAIVDDEPKMRAHLSGYVSRYASENKLEIGATEFPSGDALLNSYAPVYDMIIFDIDMPGTNGMDAARRIRSRDENVVILFVTNIAQYAINGYEVGAVDYIIKPVGYYDFSLKLKRALRQIKRQETGQLLINNADGLMRLNVRDVLYVEVLAHYLIYHTLGQSYQVRGSMKEQEEPLRALGFCRTHKSYMVNLMHIDNIGTSEVLAGGARVPLGRTYKQALMEEYLNYLSEVRA